MILSLLKCLVHIYCIHIYAPSLPASPQKSPQLRCFKGGTTQGLYLNLQQPRRGETRWAAFVYALSYRHEFPQGFLGGISYILQQIHSYSWSMEISSDVNVWSVFFSPTLGFHILYWVSGFCGILRAFDLGDYTSPKVTPLRNMGLITPS